MELDFEKIFKISLRAMRINKSHPAVPRDTKWVCHSLFFHGIFTVVFLLIMNNIINYNLKDHDFSGTCKNGVLSVVFIVVTFQYFIMLWKQDLILELMSLMKRDYESAQSLPMEDRKIMLEYALNGRYVCKQWLITALGAFIVFPIKNCILLIYYWAKSEPQFVPLYDVVFPGIIEEYKEDLFGYIGIYIMWWFYGMYAVSMYAAFVPLGPSFMLHACGQLELVKNKIDSLFVEEDEVEDKLKAVVQHLQYIYRFVDNIKISFRVAYELTLKATTIILPITFYEVIEAFNNGEIALEFITFIIGGILISSSPCFYSDLLMEKGENVRLAMYSCGWESSYNPRVRSTIRIILVQALRPVAIRTLFRTVCLDALTDLFQQSYGIFNLMNAMWK